MIAPIALTGGGIRDPLVAAIASALLFGVAVFGFASVELGAAMLAMLLAYLIWCYLSERVSRNRVATTAAANLADQVTPVGWGRPVILSLLGLAVLIGGGRMLVVGAIDLARIAGLSETMIGLTVVAVGTSLPELVTAVVAARKGEVEIALGNVVGSNIYNILFIGGVAMLLAPGSIPSDLIPIELGMVLLGGLVILALVGISRGVSRLWGGALAMAYLGFMWFTVTAA